MTMLVGSLFVCMYITIIILFFMVDRINRDTNRLFESKNRMYGRSAELDEKIEDLARQLGFKPVDDEVRWVRDDKEVEA